MNADTTAAYPVETWETVRISWDGDSGYLAPDMSLRIRTLGVEREDSSSVFAWTTPPPWWQHIPAWSHVAMVVLVMLWLLTYLERRAAVRYHEAERIREGARGCRD